MSGYWGLHASAIGDDYLTGHAVKLHATKYYISLCERKTTVIHYDSLTFTEAQLTRQIAVNCVYSKLEFLFKSKLS